MHLRRIFPWMCIILLLFAVACGGGGGDGGSAEGGDAGGEVTVVDPATAGTISGTVNFTGTAPEPQVIQMDAEPSCLEEYTEGPFTEEVVVNDNGTLANTFVYVKSGLEGMTFATPSEKVVLDQDGCRYIPHVLGVQTDQTIVIRNSDAVLHNIHPEPVNSRSFNVGQPTEGMETERSFPAAEVMIHVGCDVHSWMSAYVGVVDHPYFAVTGADGSFELPNLPPGDYVLESWHEEYGTQTMDVTVGESETVTADFTYEGG
jgi:hypothetical protein